VPLLYTGRGKADKKAIRQLKTDIEYLASDELEGRRTASEGERKAGNYIIGRYEGMKVKPYDVKYIHPFPFVYGRHINDAGKIEVGNYKLADIKEVFPLPFSANKKIEADVLPDVMEMGSVWLMPLYESKEEADDAHFDWEKKAFEKARRAAKDGAIGVVFYDAYGAKFSPEFNSHSDLETIDIPVAFISNDVWKKHVAESEGSISVNLDIRLKKTELTGHNIAAYIDNKAKYTVVLGAHYDHLGFGEDGNSLYAGKQRQIHNGADDNASGTAALLHLAEWLKKSKLRHYNYLFVNFSGEELGLLGSKAFAKQENMDSTHIAYMLNMDMVGRLNDSTRALTLGGIGTSPSWAELPALGDKQFKINIDSAGIGPSDHSSFYTKGIPVLFFFTGSHHDYHKPSDDADKINYTGEVDVIHFIQDIITRMDAATRPAFTPTKENATTRVRFKITLGIMPDYSFNDGGVRVDGVSEGKPGYRAGLQTGDIIIGLGKDKVQGMQSYMEALSHLKEGQKTTILIMRDGKEKSLPVEFK
jgi:Zn-dependent M28 family amino/carboxypeptidase